MHLFFVQCKIERERDCWLAFAQFFILTDGDLYWRIGEGTLYSFGSNLVGFVKIIKNIYIYFLS